MTSPTPLLLDTYYHIYNRGNNRENIFINDQNYKYFLQLYIKYIEPIAHTFAYCLLKNHFHLLVQIKSKNDISILKKGEDKFLRVSEILRNSSVEAYPSRMFSDFFNAYAKSVNEAYGRTGSLFQHPFGRVLINSDSQFFQVIAYIHQNPQKHHLIDDFRDWKYSSYRGILSEAPTHLQREVVLEWFGGVNKYIDTHAQWVTEGQSKWFIENDPA